MSKNVRRAPAKRAVARRAPAKRAPAKRAPRRQAVNHSVNQVVPEGDFYDSAGSLLGKGLAIAGRTAAKFFGLGDYEIKRNVLMSGNLPEVYNMPKGGGTIIRYQEYLGDIITSSTPGDFKIDAYNIQPGLPASFPWLSQIAANYEQYSLEGIVYQFKSTSANALNSVNTALGSVMLATNYDVSDPPFVSKSEMLNYEYSSSCKPSESVLHMIECDPKQSVLTELYTRTGELPSNKDLKFYDLGKFQIATVGFQGTSVNIGELHVTYQVRLLKPKLFSTLGEDIANYQTGCTDYTNALPLGSGTYVPNASNNMDLVVTGTSMRFPLSNVPETFLVYLAWQGSTPVAFVGSPIVTAVQCTAIGNTLNIVPPVGTTIQGCCYSFIVKTLGLGTNPVLNFSTDKVLPAGNNNVQIRVFQIPNSVSQLSFAL
uniref:Capsid protein n=1 Tax=RDHV-like virus SF1 TaxID=1665420 RepID=A0A0H3WJ63_9VIRU|nr:capsid protein [RDHV-like virus SF1]